jgi:hydroxymethylpyrimidine/phosphomethylpyrimidine kinase
MCCWRLTLCFIDRGLEADQKVIAAHGCYAMTATTALTAQNTQGVTGIHETPSEFVKKCIDACAEDVGIDVVKTGKFISLPLFPEIALLDDHMKTHSRLKLM